MTKKEFKQALMRGLGRCYYAVKENPEKFKDLVFWGAFNNFPYDHQCEGTRGIYMYHLINCYEDKDDYFIKPLIERLNSTDFKNGLEFDLVTKTLACFADDGNNEAKEALWKSYDKLYNLLMKRKRQSPKNYFLTSKYEFLCITLTNDYETYLKIAFDMGKLFLERPFYKDIGFKWFYCCNDMYAKRLSKLKSKEIKSYIKANVEEEHTIFNYNFSKDAWLLNEAEELKKYESYTQEQFITELKNLKVTFNENEWHSVYGDMEALFSNKLIKNKPPKSILKAMYETTLCSYCRESIVDLMSKNRVLTKEILEECLYDCNLDIVKLAEKKLNKTTHHT